MLQTIDPTGQGRLSDQIDVMVGVALALDQRLHVVEGFAIVEGIEEGGVDQSRGTIAGNVEGLRVRRNIHATLELSKFFVIDRRMGVHQWLGVDTVAGGLGVTHLFRGDRDDLIVVDTRRQIDIASQLEDLA